MHSGHKYLMTALETAYLTLIRHSILTKCVLNACCKHTGWWGGHLQTVRLAETYSKRNASSVVVTCEVVGTFNQYMIVKTKFELCTLRDGGDIKTFQLSLAP